MCVQRIDHNAKTVPKLRMFQFLSFVLSLFTLLSPVCCLSSLSFSCTVSVCCSVQFSCAVADLPRTNTRSRETDKFSLRPSAAMACVCIQFFFSVYCRFGKQLKCSCFGRTEPRNYVPSTPVTIIFFCRFNLRAQFHFHRNNKLSSMYL